MQKHQPFGWLKSKRETDGYIHIGKVSMCDNANNALIILTNAELSKRYSTFVFNDCTFADGTPFGIKEE